MEPGTALVLAIQLIALFSIAGGLLLYLLCKVRHGSGRQTMVNGTNGRCNGSTVLITSVDTALGLQLCTHLAAKGCRVFAGMKDPCDSLPAKLLRGWMKSKENSDLPIAGSIVPLAVDVTREDVLKDATESMGAHLNAGERGILAVINTAGTVFRGKIDQQDSVHWETMFKTNVLGSLRTARAFTGLLRPTRGRLIYFGECNDGDGLVAFQASRVAVDGLAHALRTELRAYGINVITLDSHGVPAESLFRSPIPFKLPSDDGIYRGCPTNSVQQYSAEVLTVSALGVIERAIWDEVPNQKYHLSVSNSKFKVTRHLSDLLRFNMNRSSVQRV